MLGEAGVLSLFVNIADGGVIDGVNCLASSISPCNKDLVEAKLSHWMKCSEILVHASSYRMLDLRCGRTSIVFIYLQGFNAPELRMDRLDVRR